MQQFEFDCNMLVGLVSVVLILGLVCSYCPLWLPVCPVVVEAYDDFVSARVWSC